MATPLTRVTVSGGNRNVELLLPADQPVASLLPRMTEILGDPSLHDAGGSRTVLNRLGGPALSERSTLHDEGVVDGAWLYLTSTEDALPEPIVFDVSDVVEDEMPHLTHATTDRPRGSFSARLGAVALFIALWVLVDWRHALLTPATAVAAAGALIIAAALPGAQRAKSVALSAFALAATGYYLWTAHLTPWRSLAVAALVMAGVQVAHEVNRRAFRGAGVVVGCGALVAGMWAAGLHSATTERAAALCIGVLSFFLIGLAPRAALALAGLNSLDDARSRGATVRRQSVLSVLRTAHRMLAGALLWLAGSVFVASIVTARAPLTTWKWDLPLLGLLGLALLLRARHFPLAPERAALALAGIGVLTVTGRALATSVDTPAIKVAACVALTVGALALLTAGEVHAPDHVAARGRIIADRVESVAAIAIVPLLVGHFGVYSALARTFQG